MIENIKNYLKPTVAKVSLTFALVAWQYFYSYQGIRMDFLIPYGEYAASALSAFNWGSYLIRNVSLFFVWIFVAVLIFSVIWLFELLNNFIHNLKIKKQYVNKKTGDYSHLLKENIRFMEHLKGRSLWIAGIMIFLISIFALSDQLERLRFTILDSMMWNALSEGTEIDLYSNTYVIASFVVFFFVWYFISALINWIFEEQKEKEEQEKISQEHFAIEVETEENQES